MFIIFSEWQNFGMRINRHETPEIKVGMKFIVFIAVFIPRQQNLGNVFYSEFFSSFGNFFSTPPQLLHNSYGPAAGALENRMSTAKFPRWIVLKWSVELHMSGVKSKAYMA